MNFNPKSFETAAPMFIRALAEDNGLKVVFDRNQPGYARDEHTIYLPRYFHFPADRLASDPDAKSVYDAVADLYLAVGMHEINHPCWSHPMWKRWPRFSTIGPLGQWLIEALEDVRVDMWRIRSSRGALRIYDAGYGRLIRMGFWTDPEPDNASLVFQMAVLSQARVGVCGLGCFRELAAATDKSLRALTNDQFVDGAFDIVGRIALARSGTAGSEDTYTVVEELLAYLGQQQQQQQPQQSPSASSDPSDPSDQSDDQGASSASGSADDSKDPSGQSGASDSAPKSDDGADGNEDAGSSSAPSGADADPDSPGQSGSGSGAADRKDDSSNPGNAGSSGSEPQQGRDAGSQPTPSSAGCQPQAATGTPDQPSGSSPVSSAVASILDSNCDDAPKDVGSALASALDDANKAAIAAGADAYSMPSSSKATAVNVLYAGDRDTKPLAVRLKRLLMSRAPQHVSWDRRGARMDSQLLARVPLGERDIFRDERVVRAIDTAAHVVVDRSQSMQDGPIEIARTAALRLCIALSEIEGMSTSASAFPHSVGGRRDGVMELLPHGAPPRRYAHNFTSLSAPSWARTPLANALLHAEFTLGIATAKRKFCVVLTDGQPDYGTKDACVDIISRMSRRGIEVIGLGIETMAVHDLFPRFELVHKVADLESALFKVLQNNLLRKAA